MTRRVGFSCRPTPRQPSGPTDSIEHCRRKKPMTTYPERPRSASCYRRAWSSPARRSAPRREDGHRVPRARRGARGGADARRGQHPGRRHPARRRARRARPRPSAPSPRPSTPGRAATPWASRSTPPTAARSPTGWVTGTARPGHLGRTLATHEVVMTDEQGRRLSTVRMTNLLRDQ